MLDIFIDQIMIMVEVYMTCSKLVPKLVRKLLTTVRPGGSSIGDNRGDEKARRAVHCCISDDGTAHVLGWAQKALSVCNGSLPERVLGEPSSLSFRSSRLNH